MKQNEKGTPKGTLKRGFAALLTSCMCVSMVPADAFAAELQQEGYKALDMQLDAVEDIKAAEVNYSLKGETEIYLAEGQSQTVTVLGGDKELALGTADWVAKKVVNGVETEDNVNYLTVDGDGKVEFTGITNGAQYAGDVYHLYPQKAKKNLVDANGKELFYTVTYLGRVKATPVTREMKVGQTVKFTVDSAYADASAELKQLVKKNAKLTYALDTSASGANDAVVAVDPKTGVISYATSMDASHLNKNVPIVVNASSGADVVGTATVYLAPATETFAKTVTVNDKASEEITIARGESAKVTLNVAGSGKASYNNGVKVTVVSDKDGIIDTTTHDPETITDCTSVMQIDTKNVEGTATITVASVVHPEVKATVKVTTVAPEPYAISPKCDSFALGLSSDKEEINAYFTDKKDNQVISADVDPEYKVTVTGEHTADGKTAKKNSIIKKAEYNSSTKKIEVTTSAVEGYATLTIKGTCKVDETHAYDDVVTFTVYNTDNKATQVAFYDADKAGQKKAITPATTKFVVGDTYDLKAIGTKTTVAAGNPINDADKAAFSDVVWKPSNENVAQVTDGKVTIVGEGSADITATSVTSGIADPAVKATYSLTAVDLEDAVLSVDTGASGKVNTAYVTDCKDGTDVDLVVDLANVATVADIDWTITNGKEYGTLTPDTNDASKATFDPEMIVNDYQVVDVAVTMTSKLNPSTKATKTITIYITKEFNVYTADKVVINEAKDGTIALSTGDTKQLTSIVYSDKNIGDSDDLYPATVQDVIWSTPDTDVISVDANGLVKAIAASEDEVTVMATSKENQDLIAEVYFKVSDVAAESIALSESTVSLEAGAAKNVTVVVKGANDKAATNQAVTVASNNEAVATAKAADGKITVTGVAAGTANIVVTSVANKEVTATIPVTVTAAPVTPTNPTEVAVSAITLSQSSALLSAGKTVALAATVAPENATNKAVTWTSSDASVATVDANGVVTAVSAGKATITATAGTVSATCDVTVSSVKLNAKTVPLQVKKSTSALKATVSAKEDAVVSWKSSNTKVVKVNAKTGKLTATSKTGTAKITVTTKSGAKATCTVKVQKARVTTKSIAFAKKSVSLKKGKSVKLTIKRNPISATEKITWTSSNKKVATVDKNGKVTGKKAGKATITAKTSNGKKATCKVTVK